jgi:hypothetical protein
VVPTPPVTTPAEAASPSPPGPVAATRFRLTIDSTPQGATVLEGARAVGETPVTIELEAAALRETPRSYRIELAGYAPYDFTQGPSERDVEVHAALVALRTRPTRPVRPRGDGPTIGLRRPKIGC